MPAQGEFLARTVPFIEEGVARDEPVLVVVSAPKINALRARARHGAADHVQFADMAEVGRNPARIIPGLARLREQAPRSAVARLRGIGEPISADRSEAALAECHRHESLLNLAFADGSEWWLLCPYDTANLATDVVDEARRDPSVPVRRRTATGRTRRRGTSPPSLHRSMTRSLIRPPARPSSSSTLGGLAALRMLVHEVGAEAGLDETRIADLVLAADEVATNSIVHGGGTRRPPDLDRWPRRDLRHPRRRTASDDPLVGRRRPTPDQLGGRGMWLVNQLCELGPGPVVDGGHDRPPARRTILTRHGSDARLTGWR